jgi:hypothetical protein
VVKERVGKKMKMPKSLLIRMMHHSQHPLLQQLMAILPTRPSDHYQEDPLEHSKAEQHT